MSRPTKTPESLRELYDWLTAPPRLRSECDDPRIPPDPPMSFIGQADGGLWFSTPTRPRYIPIDCGLTASESGVTFRRDGFDVTKFGVTIRYFYLPDEGEEGGAP